MSDVTANLLRPCYSRQRFGRWRTFFLEDEPIDRKAYWAVCLFEKENGIHEIKFMDLSFDVRSDTVRSIDGRDLSSRGLEWTVALVPLVKRGAPVSVADIAAADYDLRQVFGRTSEREIHWVYEGWYNKWEERIEELVTEYQERRREYELFYHSILALDASGTIQILQVDATLPQLAEGLAKAGAVSAGLLDSGGSCALFDPWLQGYLNHGWYFREARGAVLCFQLRAMERLPKSRRAHGFEIFHEMHFDNATILCRGELLSFAFARIRRKPRRRSLRPARTCRRRCTKPRCCSTHDVTFGVHK